MKMSPVTQKNQIFFIQQSSRNKKYFIRILIVRAQVKETLFNEKSVFFKIVIPFTKNQGTMDEKDAS